MICNNCGAENETGAVFCKGCGQQLNNVAESVAKEETQAVEAVANEEPQVEANVSNEAQMAEPVVQNTVEAGAQSFAQNEKPVNSVSKMPKNKKKILIGAIAGGVAFITLLTVLICVLVSNASTIKLDEYVKVETSGYDGYGTAKVSIDWDRVDKKYGDKIKLTSKARKEYGGILSSVEPIELLKTFVSIEVDKKSDLSNGDKIKYKIKVDKNMDKYLECKLKVKNGTKTVKKLKKVGKFDAFKDLTVTFEGISPNGKAKYEYTGDQLGYYDFSFSKTYGLKNGDKITVTIPSSDMEYYAREYGEIPEKTEMEYEVEGLDEYVSEYSKITSEFLTELKGEVEDTIYSYTAKDYDSTSKLSELKYAGYIFKTVIDTDESYNNYNELYIIYSGTVSNSENKFTTTKVYYPVKFTNILSKGDELSCDDNKSIIGGVYLDNSWHYTKGYINPLTSYIDATSSYADNYEVEAGDGYEEYAEYELISELKDISEEYKTTLADDAKKRIEDYIADDYNENSTAADLKTVGEYLLVAKEESSNFENSNKYIVVFSATVSNSEDRFATTTVYFPVEYDGLVKFSDDEYMYTSVKGILGNSSFSDSWYSTKGYLDGAEMYSKVVTANREDYKYEVSESLKGFGK